MLEEPAYFTVQQKAVLDLLETLTVPSNDDAWQLIAEAAKKVWDALPLDDPRKHIHFEAVTPTREERLEGREVAIRICGPRWAMQRLCLEYRPIDPDSVDVTVTVEKI
jgi:hypothetical protein